MLANIVIILRIKPKFQAESISIKQERKQFLIRKEKQKDEVKIQSYDLITRISARLDRNEKSSKDTEGTVKTCSDQKNKHMLHYQKS